MGLLVTLLSLLELSASAETERVVVADGTGRFTNLQAVITVEKFPGDSDGCNLQPICAQFPTSNPAPESSNNVSIAKP